MNQWFCIVSHNIDEETNVKMVCGDFIEACATQLSMLVGAPVEICKPMLKEEDILTIKKNLETQGRDRISNDEEEVYIFWIPGREVMCNKKPEKTDQEKKEDTFKCLQCGEKIVADVTNIPYGTMYTTICSKCGFVIPRKNFVK